MVKVSVIVVSLNCIDYIEACINSITNLKKKFNVELIIVDGISNDGTLEILNKYKEDIDTLIVEKDKGIYDAMNKGIKYVTGDYYIFIGSDDEMLDIPVKELEEANKEGYLLVAGAVKLTKGIFKSFYSWRIHISNTIHHQSLFYSSKMKVEFNTSYKVFADFDLNQKFYKNKTSIKFVDNVITRYNEEGISSSGKYDKEQISIVRDNFGFAWAKVAEAYLKYQHLKNK